MKRPRHTALLLVLVVILVTALVRQLDPVQFPGSPRRCLITDSIPQTVLDRLAGQGWLWE